MEGTYLLAYRYLLTYLLTDLLVDGLTLRLLLDVVIEHDSFIHLFIIGGGKYNTMRYNTI
jgi:hypothetical protein